MARKAKPHKSIYQLRTPHKYVGNPHRIVARSGWESQVFAFFDHPENHAILRWGSEIVQIPYLHPLKRDRLGKPAWTVYIPDLLVELVGQDGVQRTELIEIKPAKEVPGYQPISKTGKPLKVSPATMTAQLVNQAKWEAARVWCGRHNITFRVVTEATLFSYDPRFR